MKNTFRTLWPLAALAALLVAGGSSVAAAQTERPHGAAQDVSRPGLSARDLQGEFAAADSFYNARQWDQAIAAYNAILTEAPALSVCYLRIAEAYDVRHDYEHVLATYTRLLTIDPANADATVGMAMTNLEKGDLKAAQEWLLKAAKVSNSREIFYDLGELKLAAGHADEAATWYQKAAAADPSWSKPSFKLALVALQKGNRKLAATMLEKVIAIDHRSPEAAQAVTIIGQLTSPESPSLGIPSAYAPLVADTAGPR